MNLPPQAEANFRRAATMQIGTGFELDTNGVSLRTVQQTEAWCTRLRQRAGQPGRVSITRRGAVVRVMAVAE